MALNQIINSFTNAHLSNVSAKCLTYDYLEFKYLFKLFFHEKKEKIFEMQSTTKNFIYILLFINIKYLKIIIIMNGK